MFLVHAWEIVDNGNRNELPLRNKRVIVTVYIKSKLHVIVLTSNIFDYTKYTYFEKLGTAIVYCFQDSKQKAKHTQQSFITLPYSM